MGCSDKTRSPFPRPEAGFFKGIIRDEVYRKKPTALEYLTATDKQEYINKLNVCGNLRINSAPLLAVHPLALVIFIIYGKKFTYFMKSFS